MHREIELKLQNSLGTTLTKSVLHLAKKTSKQKNGGNQLFHWMEGNWIRAILYWSLAPTRQAAGKGAFSSHTVQAERGVGRIFFSAFIINISTWQKTKTHTAEATTSQDITSSISTTTVDRYTEGPLWIMGGGGGIISCSTPEEQVIIVSARKWWSQAVGANLKMKGLRLVRNKQTVRGTPMFGRQKPTRAVGRWWWTHRLGSEHSISQVSLAALPTHNLTEQATKLALATTN